MKRPVNAVAWWTSPSSCCARTSCGCAAPRCCNTTSSASARYWWMNSRTPTPSSTRGCGYWRARTYRWWRWAMTTSPSMAGAARRSRISSASARIFPLPAWCAWSRITALPRPYCAPPTALSPLTRAGWARSCGPRGKRASPSPCMRASTSRMRRASWWSRSRRGPAMAMSARRWQSCIAPTPSPGYWKRR